MSGQDNDLLARLNALKPSTVAFGNSTQAASVDVEIQRPHSVEDRLAERLKSLRSGGLSSPAGRHIGTGRDDAESLTARVKDEVTSERDPIKDWQQDDVDNEQSLDDLLAELASDENQWKLDPDDAKHVESLLREAKEALPPDDDAETNSAVEKDQAEATKDHLNTQASEAVDESQARQAKTEAQQDEEEADDYVQRVLAELEIEKKYGNQEGNGDENDRGDSTAESQGYEKTSAGLYLPQAPSTLPPSEDPPAYEDSELEARFSKLGLDLPSTPVTTPSSNRKTSKPTLPSVKAKKSNLPSYTDEDIDSWCCICNEDGEVKCLGCDGDVYCNDCWREGHGNRPGQERGHRAVRYNKGGGLAAA